MSEACSVERMEFNAQQEGEGGGFWLSMLDDTYEAVKAARAAAAEKD